MECDVRLSGEGSAVVFHDADLRRLCGVALEVERTPGAVLAKHRLLGSNQCIPMVGQLLELVAGRVPVLLELKTRDRNAARLCRAIVAAIEPTGGSVGVMSFDPRVAHWLWRNAPHVRRGLVIRESLPLFKRWIAMLIARPQFLAVDIAALDRAWAARARRTMPVYCWTVRNGEQRRALTPLADALIWETDGRP